MKNLLIAFGLSLFTLSAFADCTLSFKKPRDGGMAINYISDRTYHKILDILADKGYEVFTPEELNGEKAAFSLKVAGHYGYGCGTGLTFKDYLTVPAYNNIVFKGENGVNVDVSDSFSQLAGVKTKAKRHLMNTIKALPECKI